MGLIRLVHRNLLCVVRTLAPQFFLQARSCQQSRTQQILLPTLLQLASGWFAAILFSITITFASITPKIVSGYSLKSLLESATTDKMQGEGAQQVRGRWRSMEEIFINKVKAGVQPLNHGRGEHPTGQSRKG